MPASVGTPLLWGAFTLFVLCLLALDLGVFHRKAHAVGARQAPGWGIFSYFSVPAAYQHRVLFWGILGAIIFRVIFILAGAALLAAFHWVIYVFGGLLILPAVRIVRARDEEVHPERNPLLRLVRRVVPVVSTYQGPRFFVRAGGRPMATA